MTQDESRKDIGKERHAESIVKDLSLPTLGRSLTPDQIHESQDKYTVIGWVFQPRIKD